MYCTNCGKKIEDDSSYCENCGVRILTNNNHETVDKKDVDTSGIDINVYPTNESSIHNESVSTYTVPLPLINANKETLDMQNSSKQSTVQKNKRLIVIIGIAVLLIAFAVIAVLVSEKNNEYEESNGSFSNGESLTIQNSKNPEVQTEPKNNSPESSGENNNAQNSVSNKASDYILPKSDSRYFSTSELADLSNYELYLARNEIFARHGREFKNQDLRDYFSAQSWYVPKYSGEKFDSLDLLNDYEKKNADTIRSIEQDRGSSYLN